MNDAGIAEQQEPIKPLVVRRLEITNFRGVKKGTVEFHGDTLLVGGNNAGKSTICEALELVLGPERGYRRPIVNEHDFHAGRYLDDEGNSLPILIDVVLLNLPDEMEMKLFSKTRPWSDTKAGFLDVDGAVPEDTDVDDVCRALPLKFVGYYDRQEDDFVGTICRRAFFTRLAGSSQIPSSRLSSDQRMPDTSLRRCPVIINNLRNGPKG